MKKLNNMFLIGLISVYLSACNGGTTDTGSPPTNNPTPPQTPTNTGTETTGTGNTGTQPSGTTTPLSLANIVLAVGNSITLNAAGGSGNYLYSLVSGTNVTLNGTDLSGTRYGSSVVSVYDGQTTVSANVTVKGVQDLWAFKETTCARLTDDSVQCFGIKANNGVGTMTTSSVENATNFSNATSLAKTQYVTCGVLNGAVKCVGNNSYGHLGVSGVSSTSTLLTATGLDTNISKVVNGKNFFCALSTSASGGKVYCWGENPFGQTGSVATSGGYTTTPTMVNLPEAVNSISVASGLGEHVCALATQSGKVYCWGKNSLGQLGNGTTTSSATPVQVLSQVSDVVAGAYHSCAVVVSGQVRCWGYNANGQLGNTSTGGLAAGSSPLVDGLSSAITLVSADETTCAKLSDSTVSCWGQNSYGEVGIGSANFYELATATDLTGVSYLAAGGGHICARLNDKSLSCWGKNNKNQIGNVTDGYSNYTKKIMYNWL